MDIATIIGMVSGIGFVIATILMGSGLGLFINIPSVLIVVGGCFAATLIAFPLKDFLMVIGLSIKVFMFKIDSIEDLITQLVDISNKSRKGGLLSIEGDIEGIKDLFLADALKMSVDGTATQVISDIMQKKIELVAQKHKVGCNIFSALGKYAPAFGMVGTLIGLVQMLANLDDPSTIGPKMAVAMITTFYGAVLANLFFLPMADKLKLRSTEEIKNMNLLYEGVLSIREGEHPRLLEDKLKVYSEEAKKDEGNEGK